jgi:hypothetical protein
MWHALRRKVGWAAGQTAKCNIRKGESRSTTGEKTEIKKGKDLSSRNRFEATNSYRKKGRKKGRKEERKKKENIRRHETGLK